jgi:hypothetical protein
MLKKIRIKNKKKFMYIVIAIILVICIAAWIYIIRKSSEDSRIELERERSEEESPYADEKLYNVEDMIKVGEQQKEIEEKYPWYYDLPIEEEDFVVVWDWEKEKFRIDLKIDEGSAQSLVDRITREAVSEIEKLTETRVQSNDYYVIFN